MILRVRTQLGTWRLTNVQGNDTMAMLRERLEKEHHSDLMGRPLMRDPGGLGDCVQLPSFFLLLTRSQSHSPITGPSARHISTTAT